MTLNKNNNQSLWIQPYKLICPSINQQLLVRERLLSLLDQSRTLPLTCVYSPAGFGKSTLVVNWLRERRVEYGWYSLDINDNDTSYFANHLIYALHNASHQGCPQTLDLVQQQEYSNLHSLLAKAMMEIAQSRVSFCMVLDDVHTITNPAIVDALRHWLKLLPPQIHVIFCCQNEPPIPLSSFRVKGQLLEIGAEQLAFTTLETHAFLKQNLSFDVNAQLAKELSDKTGGWPAALQLISHDARSSADLIDASGRLGHAAYEVDAFIVHEVIGQQPDSIRQLLASICVFEQFNEPLCREMLNRNDCDALIFELEQRQLFIHRVDGQERWYRFQDIFRDTLLKQVRAQGDHHWRELQCRTVRAYLNCGLIMEAVQLGLQIRQPDIICDILRHSGQDLYRQGQFKTLTRLLDELTAEVIQQDSALTLLHAWILLATYRENEVGGLLADLSQADEKDREGLWAEHAVAQAQAAINNESFTLAKSLAEQAISLLKPDSYVSRTITYSVLGQSALCQGELSQAISLLKEAENLAFENRLAQQRLWSMCLISDAYTAWGKVDTALDVQQAAIDMAFDGCIEDVLHMEFLYRNRTHLLLERGDLSAADKLLLKSEQVIEPLGSYGLLNIYMHRGLIALWRGQRDTARNLAFQVNYLLQNYEYHTDWLAYAMEFLLACQCSALLDFEPNWVWRDAHLSCPANNHFYQHYQRVHAVFLYQHGERELAMQRVTELVAIADQYDLKLQALKGKLQLAIWKADDDGLRLWAAQLPLLSELKPLQTLWLGSLFSDAEQHRDWPDWSVWFSQRNEDDPKPNRQFDAILDTLNNRYANALDLVTPKEVQVLLLIGEGLNNDEIASSMHVALSTVKSHIRRLYRKLNISKRSQAQQIYERL